MYGGRGMRKSAFFQFTECVLALLLIFCATCPAAAVVSLSGFEQQVAGWQNAPVERARQLSDQVEKMQAMEEGLFRIFVEAGCAVSTPTCGPCLGGHMGILAAGERAVATTNRNFVGRMGHVESEVYLASPAVAAATAVTGYLTDPATLETV